MNDEIKEILDYLTKFINDKEEITKYGCEISVKQAKQLLDYITNLQQDNTLYAQLKDEYEEEIKDLQQENERLKSELECYENGVYFSSKVDELERENERLKIQVSAREELYEYSQSRIEKAVEYIKKHIEKCNIDGYEGKFDNFDIFTKPQKLLNILNGRSDE